MFYIRSNYPFLTLIVSFHSHNPFVHELIVGDTLKVFDLFNITLFKNNDFPVRYFPTIVNMEI
jgi:hypothetical protein